MDVGVVQMPVDSWSTTVERARELEAMGFDHLWIYDHLSWRHYRDHAWHAALPWLTGLAASTTTIRLGTMVASPTLRHPLLLAKESMSLDHVSGGRFILGLGAGAAGFDATAYGDDPLSPPDRADRFAEYARVVDGLLRGELTDHAGRWYTVDGGRVLPGCVQRPRLPLALASGGPRTTRMAAEVADTWITLGDRSGPPDGIDDFLATVARQSAWLDDGCTRIDRDPTDVGRIALVSSTFAEPLSSFEAFVHLAGGLDDLGFDTVVIHDHRGDDPALDVGPAIIEAIAAWRDQQHR